MDKFYGYLNSQPLQRWYIVEIVEEQEHKEVFFNSKIHLNKRVKVSCDYSLEFSDTEILRDHTLITDVLNRYGSDIFEVI